MRLNESMGLCPIWTQAVSSTAGYRLEEKDLFMPTMSYDVMTC